MKGLQTIFVSLLLIVILVFWLPDVALLAAQQKEPQTSGSTVDRHESHAAIVTTPTQAIKVMREYHGIRLGMKRDEVRDALGKPRESSIKDQDTFKLGGDDLLTAHYENDRVRVIQLYFFESEKVPNWADVVGDTKIEQKPDGSKVARVEITEENFWISMFQGKSGDVTTITISRSLN
jgi:hypothetical protein